MIRKLTKSILYKLLNRENHNISKILKDYNSKFNLLDVGAAGGIHNRWHIIDEKIKLDFKIELSLAEKTLCQLP